MRACCGCVCQTGARESVSTPLLRAEPPSELPEIDLVVLEAQDHSLKVGFYLPRVGRTSRGGGARALDCDFLVSVLGNSNEEHFEDRISSEEAVSGGSVSTMFVHEVRSLKPGTKYTVSVESAGPVWRGHRLSATVEARTTDSSPGLSEEDFEEVPGEDKGKKVEKDADKKQKGSNSGSSSSSSSGAVHASTGRSGAQGDDVSTVVPDDDHGDGDRRSDFGSENEAEVIDLGGGADDPYVPAPPSSALGSLTSAMSSAMGGLVGVTSRPPSQAADTPRSISFVDRSASRADSRPLLLDMAAASHPRTESSDTDGFVLIEGDEIEGDKATEKWHPARLNRLTECNLCSHFMDCLKPRVQPGLEFDEGSVSGVVDRTAPTPAPQRKWRPYREPFPGVPVDPASVGLGHKSLYAEEVIRTPEEAVPVAPSAQPQAATPEGRPAFQPTYAQTV